MAKYYPYYPYPRKSTVRLNNRVVFNNGNSNYNRRKRKRANALYLWIQSVLESVIAAFLLLTFVFRVNIVVGSSMEPTLQEDDRIVVVEAFYTPSYGDIVALWAEGLYNRQTGEKGEMIVKRVIGLPGDTIYIDPDTGVVYRNNIPVPESYIAEPISADNLGNAKYPLTVADNCVFVLGDNRNHSTDSRYVDDGEVEYYVGCVDMRYIMGKAVLRIYPFDRIGALQ